MNRTRSRLAALALAGAVFLISCAPPAVEPADYLEGAWESYLRLYVADGNRVVDPRRDGGMVTSEGQSYLLLRALWERDSLTFRRGFEWTEKNLKRPDGLYSWLWSPREARVLDSNSATDADQDIAFALLLAARNFEAPGYRERAVELLEAIRRHSALELDEGWFPAAGNWAVEERVTNPSYFVPYAYPHFHRAHPEGDWLEALDAGYRMLDSLRHDPSFVLPPDFLLLRRNTSVAPLPTGHPLSGDFSFDAVRLYWRVELDCLLEGRPEACREPPGLDRLVEELEEHGRLATRYSPAGEALTDEESLSFYGALLPSLRRLHPPLARRILEENLAPYRLANLLEAGDRYYDRNWVWFGLAVESGVIPEDVGK